MNILHIITSLTVGGAQSMLHGLLSAWKDAGDRHSVVALARRGAIADAIRRLGVEVRELELEPGRPSPAKIAELRRIARDLHPDVVQTWMYHADLLGGVVARLAVRAPVVWGIHHTLSAAGTLRPATSGILRMNALLSHMLPTRIVCCSRSACDTHLRIGYDPQRMLVIPNGVDPGRFQPDPAARLDLRHELRLPPDARLIGMFARFHPQKDHHNLIRAAGMLVGEVPDLHFVLAGEGVEPGNPELQRWIGEAGLAARMHLLGLRHDLPRLHAALDVFTLTSSDGEALPLVIAEALASGVPCVATDVGDAARLIGEAGQCVPPRDPAALAAAWSWILRQSPEGYARLGSLARRQVQSEYNLETVWKKYRDLYRQLLAGREQ